MVYDFSEHKSLVPIKYKRISSYMTDTSMEDIEVVPQQNNTLFNNDCYVKFKELNKNTSYFKQCLQSGMDNEQAHQHCATIMIYLYHFYK